MNSVNIKQLAPGRYQISGKLTFAMINAKTPLVFAAASDASISLDFSDVVASDSAGLVLIIEWLKSARSRQQTLHLENLPEQILALAKLGGVDAMLTTELSPKSNKIIHG